MSGYIGVQPVPQTTMTHETFPATAGQTSFATAGYTPNYLQVFLNGVKLVNGTDFTATNGSDVVLTSGAADGDTLEVLAFSTYEVNAQTYTGGLTVDNDGATVLTVDRATSDGTLVDFQKDGTSVGSIGSAGTGVYLSGDDTVRVYASNGVRLYDNVDGGIVLASSRVYPSGNTGSTIDASISLGSSSARFKDLYLSGGVHLGGTGSANKLDDYEEGTFTPYIVGIDGIPQSGYTYGAQGGSYTKLGNMVSVRIVIGTNVSVSNGNAVYFSLPFAVSNADISAYGAVSPLTRYVNFGTDQYPVVEVTRGTSRMAFMKCTSNNTTTLMTNYDLGTTMNLNVSIVYQTDA